MEYRKITCFNHTSLSVNVPSVIAAKIGIKKGDYVMIDYSKGVITIEKAPDKIKQAAEENKK